MLFSYAERLCEGIAGAAVIKRVPGAGHLAELDAPGPVTEAILDFLR